MSLCALSHILCYIKYIFNFILSLFFKQNTSDVCYLSGYLRNVYLTSEVKFYTYNNNDRDIEGGGTIRCLNQTSWSQTPQEVEKYKAEKETENRKDTILFIKINSSETNGPRNVFPWRAATETSKTLLLVTQSKRLTFLLDVI